MEYVLVRLILSEFEANRSQFSEVEYKEVSIKDNFFEGDATHAELKKASIKAYKLLKEYEFKKRNP